MTFICADSNFLLALYDPTDQHHPGAPELFASLFEDIPGVLVAPWPALYETLTSGLVKRKQSIADMSRHFAWLKARNQLRLVDDSSYRSDELEATLAAIAQPQYRPLSLADRVIRRMISDASLRIEALLSLNARDFHDVCLLAKCEIIKWDA